MKKNKRLWFRAKYFGWGWYPATWEGWSVLAIYLVYLFYSANKSKELIETANFFPLKFSFGIFFATFLLIVICYLKGEKPRWRWGK